MKIFVLMLLAAAELLMPKTGFCLVPDEIVVVANRKATSSVSLAEYYIKKRSIPIDNLIVLRSTWKESCSRDQYNEEIAIPLLTELAKLKTTKKIKCLVMMYGLPLKIKSTGLTGEQQIKHDELKASQEIISIKLQEGGESKKSLENELKRIKQLNILQMKNNRAAVDSELSLLESTGHSLSGWLPNPLFDGFKGKNTGIDKEDVLIVSRLDGPDPATVRRMIDDGIEVEKTGLKGIAYFDARWPKPESKKLTGYALYDASLHEAAQMLKKNGFPVVLDAKSDLFKAGDAPSAALYCGWYSLANYVDAFDWQKGAVGYHIASAECSTLKRKGSNVWCKKMLEDGVAATVGPVYEPYVQGFPLPQVFFLALYSGRMALGEVFFVSQPYLSWQTILVGDPLYRPFKVKEKTKMNTLH